MNEKVTFDDIFDDLPDDSRRRALFMGTIAASIVNAQREYEISDFEAASLLGISRSKLKKMKLGEAYRR